MGFFQWYFNLSDETSEQQVLCPFPHKTHSGELEYQESHPSASVNTSKGLFHCKACGRGYNLPQFIAVLFGCKLSEAMKIIPAFENNEDVAQWLTLCKDVPTLTSKYGITEAVSKELMLASHGPTDDSTIMFPVFLFGKLVDIRTYNPTAEPKCRSRIGCTNGYVVPYDIWVNDTRNTLLCAGEKDMAVARSHGFNAITITGGEYRLPLMLNAFKGKEVSIVYDNDDTGRTGAYRVADALHRAGAKVRVVTSFHMGMQNKEDITDYFVKYGKTRQDLIACITNTPLFVPEHAANQKCVTLHEASRPQHVGKILHSNMQVIAVSDSTFIVPAEFIAEKTRLSDDDKANTMHVGETRTWALEDSNAQEVLHLMDNSFTEKQILEHKKHLMHIPLKERNVKFSEYGKVTIYKASVTDMFETAAESDQTMPTEYLVYSIGTRLESGKKYFGTYKLVPHPYNGQQLVMILLDVVEASDTVSGFSITPQVIESLDRFRLLAEGKTTADTVHGYVERVKGLLGYNGNDLLIETIDLAYHTPLEFNLGRFNKIRAYLDTLVVGESRVGKSSTAETLRRTYGLGTFVSLAGNSATVSGLIGGSNKVGGSYQTKAGLIPQNHKGMMIFEEFGKCKSDIVTELTDIRSSNEVRITRVSGTLTLPAMVRMIALSNVRNTSKEIKPIASYPHGIAVVTELVGSAEDIARYDVMLVLSDRGNTEINPFWEPETPMAIEDYRTRIRWIWSRSADDVVIDEQTGRYIAQKANELNSLYDTHIKVFGTEAWKKLARLAIAIAGYTVSTDSTYNKIIVRNHHIDYAFALFIKLYDNPTFRLREYVTHERAYSQIDEAGIALLQDLYAQSPGAILHLEQEHKTNKAMLSAAAGLSTEQLNSFTNRLIGGKFVRLSGNDIIPTERFRLGMSRISRDTVVRRLGME